MLKHRDGDRNQITNPVARSERKVLKNFVKLKTVLDIGVGFIDWVVLL